MGRKTLTLRMDDELGQALAALSTVLRRSMNQLANEAVSKYVSQQSRLVERDLEKILERLRAYKVADPEFEKAIADFADAEVEYDDTVEGALVPMGQTQKEIRKLLGEA